MWPMLVHCWRWKVSVLQAYSVHCRYRAVIWSFSSLLIIRVCVFGPKSESHVNKSVLSAVCCVVWFHHIGDLSMFLCVNLQCRAPGKRRKELLMHKIRKSETEPKMINKWLTLQGYLQQFLNHLTVLFFRFRWFSGCGGSLPSHRNP